MSKTNDYIEKLKNQTDWIPFLLAESNLPGPRGNLELMAAVADCGDEAMFKKLIDADRHEGSTTANEFLPCCGVVGLGSLLALKNMDGLPLVRSYANDERWRLREAAAMALQRWGKADMPVLLDEMLIWAGGTYFDQRAAAAGLCEPALLKRPVDAERVLAILDHITATIPMVSDRKDEKFRALRQGLAYCWSVAVAALPEEGKTLMEKWMVSPDQDIRWLMKENLKKHRLVKIDAAWTAAWLAKI